MTAADDEIRVLLVDDDRSVVDMLATVLRREDDRFEVRTETTVEGAIDALADAPIDCIVSDYRMPGTDGLEFLETVRAEHGDLPFALLTGAGDEGVASEAISAGVTDYVRKEAGSGEYSLLATRLGDAVEKRRTRRELEQRNRELEELNERFESFLRHSPDVITIFDAEGTIRYANPAAQHVFGYEREELVGTDGLEHIHPEDEDDVEAAFRAVVSDDDNERVSFECRVECGDGSWVWIESIVSDRVGEEGFLVSSRDVSERKAHERELEQKTDRLEEFASIVSHDLQSPLTVADARLELAAEDCDSEHLAPLGDALDRMDEIIEATLTLAREGRVVDETEPVDVIEAAERCWSTVATDDAAIEPTAEELVVEADRERLRRVLENLFSNAVEHGGADVTVRIGDHDPGNGFYIADDGPGVPPADREAVFEPGHSMAESGTGFGLAIVEEIVEAHGWGIGVTDSWADGARFEITGVETQ